MRANGVAKHDVLDLASRNADIVEFWVLRTTPASAAVRRNRARTRLRSTAQCGRPGPDPGAGSTIWSDENRHHYEAEADPVGAL